MRRAVASGPRGSNAAGRRAHRGPTPPRKTPLRWPAAAATGRDGATLQSAPPLHGSRMRHGDSGAGGATRRECGGEWPTLLWETAPTLDCRGSCCAAARGGSLVALAPLGCARNTKHRPLSDAMGETKCGWPAAGPDSRRAGRGGEEGGGRPRTGLPTGIHQLATAWTRNSGQGERALPVGASGASAGGPPFKRGGPLPTPPPPTDPHSKQARDCGGGGEGPENNPLAYISVVHTTTRGGQPQEPPPK